MPTPSPSPSNVREKFTFQKLIIYQFTMILMMLRYCAEIIHVKEYLIILPEEVLVPNFRDNQLI